MDADWLLHPFTLGLGLGLLIAGFVLFRLLGVRGDLSRYRRHLSDKLEIEADMLKRLKKEKESLLKENENLRIKVSSFNEIPDRRLHRDLEVYARAEKQMLVGVPGFAPAWEKARNDALTEVESEEAGRSIPKRVFSKLFGAPRVEEPAQAKLLADGEPDREPAEKPDQP